MRGITRSHQKSAATRTAALMLLFGSLLIGGQASLGEAQAQTVPTQSAAAASTARTRAADGFALRMTLQTHLAYVRSGDPTIDRNSQLGLDALSRQISLRTAFEPASAVGVNIDSDELAFFPLLYWPVPDRVKPLKAHTIARVNAYMKRGGVILFDSRNQIDNINAGGFGLNAGRSALATLLGRMDIPPLEPTPSDHVLTRSFYLLGDFPGRWRGGKLWVEALGKTASGETHRARSADGVSAVLITSNDMAAAWATDKNGRTLYPVVPGGERQREMAYRTGINIVMYALTGNYKSDQVHLPALMRRLGQ